MAPSTRIFQTPTWINSNLRRAHADPEPFKLRVNELEASLVRSESSAKQLQQDLFKALQEERSRISELESKAQDLGRHSHELSDALAKNERQLLNLE